VAATPPPRIPFQTRSRLVAWAKILLPLAALALMSTVFLLAREPKGDPEIPFAQLQEIAREPRMDRPRLAGVAPDGTTVALSAERLVPQSGSTDLFTLIAPRLDTAAAEGGSLRLTASTGEVDGAARRLRLSGGIRIEASGGYAIQTPELSADLRSGSIETGPVTAEAPLGRIESGGLRVTQGEGDGARLVFNGGVRVLYQPKDPSSPEAPR
jgi:lipopolysaccharide export system protein LptC